MTVSRPFPIDKAFPNAVDIRRAFSGIVPKAGVFADAVSTGSAGIIYAGSGWTINALPFVAALRRGSANGSLSYGTALVANDAAGAAWTAGGAPVSGTRIDRLYVKAADPGQGEAAGASSAAPAAAVFGIVEGVAGTNPAVPNLPAGAEGIGTVRIPAGATSLTSSGVVITNNYAFACLAGSTAFFRTGPEMNADTGFELGHEAYLMDSGTYYFLADTGSAPAKAWVKKGVNPSSRFLDAESGAIIQGSNLGESLRHWQDSAVRGFAVRAAGTLKVVVSVDLWTGTAANTAALLSIYLDGARQPTHRIHNHAKAGWFGQSTTFEIPVPRGPHAFYVSVAADAGSPPFEVYSIQGEWSVIY